MTDIRNTIPYRKIDDINARDTNDRITEWLTIEVQLDKKLKWRISNVYHKKEQGIVEERLEKWR